MSGDGSQHPEQRLAEVLAAYDDVLAAGRETPTDDPQETIDPAPLPEWNRLTAFLTLLEEAWPRSNRDADCPSELAPLATAPQVALADMDATGQFGRFQILRTLGQGGFGIVFLAWDATLRRRVVLKVPQPETLVSPEARKRFVREARAAAGLDHPNIVPVYETGSVGPVAYIAAAYCPVPRWRAGWRARLGPCRCATRPSSPPRWPGPSNMHTSGVCSTATSSPATSSSRAGFRTSSLRPTTIPYPNSSPGSPTSAWPGSPMGRDQKP